jgi:hypothetical protein
VLVDYFNPLVDFFCIWLFNYQYLLKKAMIVKSTYINDSSLVRAASLEPDFEDCFTTTFQADCFLDLETTVYKCFSALSAGWIDALFKLRSILVKPFNLKTPPEESSIKLTYEKIVPGGKVAFFDVLDVSPTEVLMCIKDSHLNAYLSIDLIQNGKIKTLAASTTVEFNNSLGKIYLAVIKPFHKLLIKTMLRKVAIELSKN